MLDSLYLLYPAVWKTPDLTWKVKVQIFIQRYQKINQLHHVNSASHGATSCSVGFWVKVSLVRFMMGFIKARQGSE